MRQRAWDRAYAVHEAPSDRLRDKIGIKIFSLRRWLVGASPHSEDLLPTFIVS